MPVGRRRANVVFVFQETVRESYRLVTLTSTVCKLLELMIIKQVEHSLADRK